MSLYRRYRPSAFNDVLGQDHIVTTLEQAVTQGKLSHAYLFSGPRGTGKTSIARILAKILMTHGIEDDTMKRQILKGVEEGSIVDLIEIDAASNRRIDDIRSLLESIQFSPVAAAAKVYIIDEAHMLTKEAFNALLKTLEEPPAYAFFILATTELHKIPATIQSRCQRFLFRQHREETLVARLRYIADKEGITVDDEALKAIALHAQGGMRDAISILDQLRSLPSITAADVTERVGETGHEYVTEARAAITARDANTVLEIVDRMEQVAVPIEGFLRLLLTSLRDDLHAATAERPAEAPQYLRSLDIVANALRDMRTAPVPVVVLETALLMLAGLAPAAASSAPVSSAPPAAPAAPAVSAAVPPKAATPVAPAPTPLPVSTAAEPKPASAAPVVSAAPTLSLSALLAAWPDLVNAAEPASVKMSLKNGRVTSIDGETIVLTFGSAFHRDKVADSEGLRAVETRLQAMFGQSLHLKCILEGEGRVAPVANEVVDMAAMAGEIF